MPYADDMFLALSSYASLTLSSLRQNLSFESRPPLPWRIHSTTHYDGSDSITHYAKNYKYYSIR